MRCNIIKKLIVFLIVIVMSLSLLSCGKRDESFDLKICGSFAVPGMYCSNLKGNESSVTIIERDSYGRILFEYKTDNYLLGKEETVYVVCQKYDSKYVYFYEDKCYDLSYGDGNNIEELKINNDWNNKLDYSKMSRRESEMTIDLKIKSSLNLYMNDVRAACCKELKIENSIIKDMCIDDCDFVSNSLYYLIVGDSEQQRYFIIVDLDYNVSFIEITDNFNMSDLAQFKANNGWNYGF